MKSKKTNYYKEIINTLNDIHKAFPDLNLGRHISTATADYPDIWDMPDKELLYALNKYQSELELELSSSRVENITGDTYEDDPDFLDDF